MRILSIDTSSGCASCAILNDDHLVGESFINAKLTHSQTIMPMVDSLLKATQTKISEIDLFAVSVGPGSFTGLRIGISAVKGIAFALNKPCVGASTLEGLAYNLQEFDTLVCPVLDARCEQVYTALFRVQNNEVTRLWEDMAISIEEVKEKLSEFSTEKIYFVGDGARFFTPAPDILVNARASSVARVAKVMAEQNKTITADELTPVYIRLPQAERELKKKEANLK